MARLSIVCLLVGVVAAVVVPAGLAGGRATTQVVYQPFGTNGLKASIEVDDKLSGSCFTGSIASPRRDAWRCLVANELYDPCFSGPSSPPGESGFVVCPVFGQSPRTVDRIDLTKPLPSKSNTGAPGSTRGLPWALLARPFAGYCSLLTGAASSFQGKRIRYDCGRGGSLVGKPRRSTAPWTAKLLTEGDNPTLYTVRIPIAWF